MTRVPKNVTSSVLLMRRAKTTFIRQAGSCQLSFLTTSKRPSCNLHISERAYLFRSLVGSDNESQEKTVQTSSCWRRSPWPMQAAESCGQLNSQRRSVRQV